MKTRIFFLLCLTVPCLLAANVAPKPEKIYSITQVLKPLAYYKEQSTLWKNEIDQQSNDANAWLNYYAACRMANLRTYSPTKPFDLDEIVGQLSEKVPNTFEYHHVMSWHGGHTPEMFEHSQKAYDMAPDRPETYPHLLVAHQLEDRPDEAAALLQKWFESGAMSPGILSWNYNLLMSLDQDAILLTSGDNDTYPGWMLQQVHKVRPDVTILNLNLIATQPKYRNRLFEKNDIPSFDRLIEEYPQPEFFFEALSKHLIDASTNPVYLGVATSRSLRELHSENLYMVGLAFRYNDQPFDNVAVLKHNFEQKFLTDYLGLGLYNDFSASVVDQMNLNYIPPFIVLHKHYTSSGELQKANNLKELTLTIARRGKQEANVMAYLGEEVTKEEEIKSTISVKKLDKSMKKISGRLYAAETELSNGDYENFLIDLVKNKGFEQLAVCKPQQTDWRSLLAQKFRNTPTAAVYVSGKTPVSSAALIEDFSSVPDGILFQNGHPDADNSPLQNISYEAAVLYCEWITKVYNQSDERKRKFKKVLFRLPTEAEWELAALGGRMGVTYPWGGAEITNAKGCYLSNINVTELQPCKDCKNKAIANDGGFFTVVADAYFPNDLGLYGCVGNVAEMVQEKGVSKGGSWEDRPADCQIKSRKMYSDNSPAIGFRVFMEIIEQ
ncbi:MAG: SUMF1/EgtB/PvdO family nonheme iron enzyme [Bacteroidota bacterium]